MTDQDKTALLSKLRAEGVQAGDEQFPAGAIVNGRTLAERLEAYPFESKGGDLRLCSDWVEFRRCFEHLADWIARAALASAPVAGEARMPPGYKVKMVEGPGYRITPPTGGDWVAHSDSPAGDLIAALLAAPQASEAVRDAGITASDDVVLPPLPDDLKSFQRMIYICVGRPQPRIDEVIHEYGRAAVLADRQQCAGDVSEPTPDILRRMSGTHQAWSYTGLGNSMDSLHRALYRDVVAHCKRVGGAERSARNDALEEAARLIETTRETCDEPKPQQFVFGLKPRYEPRKDPFSCNFPEGLPMLGLTWAHEIRNLKTKDAQPGAQKDGNP